MTTLIAIFIVVPLLAYWGTALVDYFYGKRADVIELGPFGMLCARMYAEFETARFMAGHQGPAQRGGLGW